MKGTIMKNAVMSQNEEQATRENARAERSYVSPAVNIFETKDGFILEAEMPGVNKDGLEITLEGNALTLVGHRNDGFPQTEPLYRESRAAHFRRVFELDPALDTRKIDARMEQGILTLSLPKAEKVKPRKIAIGE
jgi:HSP20 family protein